MDIGVRSEKTYFRMVASYESREVAIVRTMKVPLREDIEHYTFMVRHHSLFVLSAYGTIL